MAIGTRAKQEVRRKGKNNKTRQGLPETNTRMDPMDGRTRPTSRWRDLDTLHLRKYMRQAVNSGFEIRGLKFGFWFGF